MGPNYNAPAPCKLADGKVCQRSREYTPSKNKPTVEYVCAAVPGLLFDPEYLRLEACPHPSLKNIIGG